VQENPELNEIHTLISTTVRITQHRRGLKSLIENRTKNCVKGSKQRSNALSSSKDLEKGPAEGPVHFSCSNAQVAAAAAGEEAAPATFPGTELAGTDEELLVGTCVFWPPWATPFPATSDDASLVGRTAGEEPPLVLVPATGFATLPEPAWFRTCGGISTAFRDGSILNSAQQRNQAPVK
jgi:hypothetical protein